MVTNKPTVTMPIAINPNKTPILPDRPNNNHHNNQLPKDPEHKSFLRLQV